MQPLVILVSFIFSYFVGQADGLHLAVSRDGYNWTHYQNLDDGNNHNAHSGTCMIYSESYHNNGSGGGDPLTPDNWAISPVINLSEVSSATLSVWACGLDPNYAAEHFALYAGTSSDPAEMTKVSDDYTATELEQWRDVLYTLQPADRLGWERSIKRRGIVMPQPIRDELLMLLQES